MIVVKIKIKMVVADAETIKKGWCRCEKKVHVPGKNWIKKEMQRSGLKILGARRETKGQVVHPAKGI